VAEPAARHLPGWPGRRTARRWTRPGGCWPTAPPRRITASSPTRSTWTWRATGGSVELAVAAPRRGGVPRRGAWGAGSPPIRGGSRRGVPGDGIPRAASRVAPPDVSVVNGLARTGTGSDGHRPVDRGDIRWLEIATTTGGWCGPGRGVRAATTDAGRGHADLPGPRRARARDAVVPAEDDRQRTWAASEPAGPATSPRGRMAGGRRDAIENDAYLVTADPGRGGTVSVTDKRTGAESWPGRATNWYPGRVPAASQAQRGSWHLAPKGLASAPRRRPRCGPSGAPSARGWSHVHLDGLEVTRRRCWGRAGRVEFRTTWTVRRATGCSGALPAGVPGGLPVYQTATRWSAGRSGWWTWTRRTTVPLDNPAYQWFDRGGGPGEGP